jgi:NADH dehydrogenase
MLMKRVVIVGAGFGGLRAARGLAGSGFDVTLLDRENYHLFQPLLYQVATASLEPESIAHPVRSIVRGWKNVRFNMTEVVGVDLPRRQVITQNGPIEYDRLVMAVGARTAFFGVESAQPHAVELKGLPDAASLRSRILAAFERAALEDDPQKRESLLSFAIVGGGPTGVEYAGALAELIDGPLADDFSPEFVAEARIVLVDMLPHVLNPYPPDLRAYAARRLEALGVELVLGTSVDEVLPDRVILADGRQIRAGTVLWVAGVEPSPLVGSLAAEQVRDGRVRVNPDLTLPDHPEVYVIGDMAYVEQDGAPLPQMAPVAMQQGAYVARHITAQAEGREVGPFRYRNLGTMAVIGRGAAVARVFGLRLTGFPAWLMWVVLHLAYLVDFRNRLVVLINWAYDYLFFERKVRLITSRDPAWTGDEPPAAQVEKATLSPSSETPSVSDTASPAREPAPEHEAVP